MKDKCNSFDARVANQFLNCKDDFGADEKIRECYRHTQRVLNSPYSSKLAKSLVTYTIDKIIKATPMSADKCLNALAESCTYIIEHT